MTVVQLEFPIDACDVRGGRVTLTSGYWSLTPTRYTPEHVIMLRQLLADGMGAVAHLEIGDAHVAILSVEAAQPELLVNVGMRGVA
jgi:hypothetical protein